MHLQFITKSLRSFAKIVFVLAALLISTNSYAQDSKPLSLSEYLEQVKGNNLNYRASNQQSESSELLKKKADLVTAINLFGLAQTSFYQQNSAAQILRYTQYYNQTYQLGFTQTSSFGLSTKLYYVMNKYTYKNFNTSNFPNPSLAASNYQTNPVIQLSLPLWQNRMGASTKAAQDSLLYQNEANKLSAQATSLSALIEAEKAYWTLAANKRIVKIQKLTLEQAQSILKYVTNRNRMNLGEKADVLQAKALVEQKTLEVRQAQNDERIAARNFNKQRFVDSDQVSDEIAEIDSKKLENYVSTKVRAGHRLDIKSAEAQMKTALANAKIEEENNKPALNLTGSYAFKGIESGLNTAATRSFDAKGEEGAIGVNFTMPINIGLSSDIRQGAVKSASSAKMVYNKKLFDQDNDWNNLIQNLENYKENLALSKRIEAAQKAKVENERGLLKQGRTTTYQVLLFEQEYTKSMLTTVQISYQILSLIADKRLYQGATAYETNAK